MWSFSGLSSVSYSKVTVLREVILHPLASIWFSDSGLLMTLIILGMTHVMACRLSWAWIIWLFFYDFSESEALGWGHRHHRVKQQFPCFLPRVCAIAVIYLWWPSLENLAVKHWEAQRRAYCFSWRWYSLQSPPHLKTFITNFTPDKLCLWRHCHTELRWLRVGKDINWWEKVTEKQRLFRNLIYLLICLFIIYFFWGP